MTSGWLGYLESAWDMDILQDIFGTYPPNLSAELIRMSRNLSGIIGYVKISILIRIYPDRANSRMLITTKTTIFSISANFLSYHIQRYKQLLSTEVRDVSRQPRIIRPERSTVSSKSSVTDAAAPGSM